jgi:hypothetical protein
VAELRVGVGDNIDLSNTPILDKALDYLDHLIKDARNYNADGGFSLSGLGAR